MRCVTRLSGELIGVLAKLSEPRSGNFDLPATWTTPVRMLQLLDQHRFVTPCINVTSDV